MAIGGGDSLGKAVLELATDNSKFNKGMSDAEGKAGGLSSKFGMLGKIGLGAAVAGVAAIGSALVVGTTRAAEQEVAVDRMRASLGLTAEEAAELGEVGREVFEGAWGESVPAVMEAVTTLRQNLGDMSAEATRELTEAALTIEDVFGASVAESTRTVSVMTKNFDGLSESQAFDIIAKGFQEGGDFSEEMLDTLREYAPAFSNMGLSADQAMGVLLAGAEAGAFNLDKVGDAMKEFEIRAQDGSDATVEGFERIGLNAADMAQKIAGGGPAAEQAMQVTLAALASLEDPVQRNMAGVALFGTTWEDLGEDVVLAMSEGMKGLDDFEGTTAQVGSDAYDNLSTNFESVKRVFLGFLADGASPLVAVLNDLLKFALKHAPEIKAAISTAMAEMQRAVDLVIGVVGPLVEWIQGLGDTTSEQGGRMQEAVQVLSEQWQRHFQPIIDQVMKAVEEILPLILPAVQNVHDKVMPVVEAIAGFFREHFDLIEQIVDGVLTIITTIISTFTLNALDSFKIFFQVLSGDFEGAGETLQGIVQRTWDAVVSIISGFIQIVSGEIMLIVAAILTPFGADRLVADMKAAGKAVVQGLVDGLQNMKDAVGRKIGEIASTITEGIKNLPGIGGIGQAGSAVISGIGNLNPFRALGGDVLGGGTYIVGERGPELFVPETDGTIIPNSGLALAASSGGPSITVQVMGNVTGADIGEIVQQSILDLRARGVTI